jgi:uncharacterized protein (UPF0261 family)
LPLGVPKLLVSASGSVRSALEANEIAMIHAIVGVCGIDRLSDRILTNAAAGIAGMVKAAATFPTRPLLAISTSGATAAGVDRARGKLERNGFDVLAFHADGAGGRMMESLITDGFIEGVLDLTTGEWADQLCGGLFAAGPERLDAAGLAGIPWVIAPGGLDRYRDRHSSQRDSGETLVRTSPQENADLGRIVAEKANAARGPVAVLLPLDGVSELDRPGGEFWSPQADGALFDALRRHLRPGIPLIELGSNINDPAFADRAAATLLELIRTQTSREQAGSAA